MTPEELAAKHFLGADYALMHPAPGAEGRMVWRKPGLDPKEYTSVLLDPTVVWQMEALAKDSGASPEELTALAKYFDDVLRKTLTSIEFPLTDVAKPRAMRISAAIVQVKTSRPALNTISSVLPVGIVMTLGRKAVGASDPSVGACTIELRFSDATTGETLGLFADHKVGDKYDTANFSKLGQTEKAMDQWAEMLRQGILKNWGTRQQ
jgi:Protein of unknown function (DUF3313).